MASTMAILILAAIASVAASQAAVQFSFRGSGQMKEEDIKEALSLEIKSGGERLLHFEHELLNMYTSLPKNADGLVSHQVVRYALHRYFLHRHGWFIRGLEPGNSTWTPQLRADGKLPPAFVKEWVPTFLQNAIERNGGDHGMSLTDMATMAATLEDLVHKEVETRLRMVYDVHLTTADRMLPRKQTEEVLSTYLMTFLLANNLTAKNRDQLMLKRQLFAKKYKGYDAVHEWFAGTVSERLGNVSEANFTAVSSVVHDIGEKYHTFNDIECNDLRSTLQRVESRKPGRVRLSAFYNLTRYTHWRFTEKADYLKTLGALDDTDPKKPSVIIANYVMARPNCLEASNLYAICCRNTCEDLMSHLEREIGSDAASPEKILQLVSALPSQTVKAPRELPSSLVSRLDQVALHNGGEVPLHGRLFAQWMHHAFPRECPYPHESGTINPQTADEWMRESGSTTQESEQEMHDRIQNDACAINWQGNPDCGSEESEIPWNPIEELLSAPQVASDADDTASPADLGRVTVGVFGLITLIAAAVLSHMAGVKSKRMSLLLVLGLVSLAYSLDLLQGSVFALALGGCVAFYVLSLVSQRANKASPGKGCSMLDDSCLPLHAKGV